MKTTLFAAAAVLAITASAPAFAQQVGSIGAAANYTNIETTRTEADGTSARIDGSVAIPTAAGWTVTLSGDVAISDNDISDETVGAGAVHLTKTLGDTWRVGGFTALSNPADDTVWAVGGQAQKYLDKVTLSGVLAYGQADDLDADLYAIRGEARYFVTDDFRLDGGVGFSKIDTGIEADLWDVNLGGEYKFANSGWSTFGRYTHAESEDLADLKSDAVKIGVRYTFGGSLKTRDRAGADLIAGGSLFGIR